MGAGKGIVASLLTVAAVMFIPAASDAVSSSCDDAYGLSAGRVIRQTAKVELVRSDRYGTLWTCSRVTGKSWQLQSTAGRGSKLGVKIAGDRIVVFSLTGRHLFVVVDTLNRTETTVSAGGGAIRDALVDAEGRVAWVKVRRGSIGLYVRTPAGLARNVIRRRVPAKISILRFSKGRLYWRERGRRRSTRVGVAFCVPSKRDGEEIVARNDSISVIKTTTEGELGIRQRFVTCLAGDGRRVRLADAYNSESDHGSVHHVRIAGDLAGAFEENGYRGENDAVVRVVDGRTGVAEERLGLLAGRLEALEADGRYAYVAQGWTGSTAPLQWTDFLRVARFGGAVRELDTAPADGISGVAFGSGAVSWLNNGVPKSAPF